VREIRTSMMLKTGCLSAVRGLSPRLDKVLVLVMAQTLLASVREPFSARIALSGGNFDPPLRHLASPIKGSAKP
jgi:hypothetical protein